MTSERALYQAIWREIHEDIVNLRAQSRLIDPVPLEAG
jgi:hypothetical protein